MTQPAALTLAGCCTAALLIAGLAQAAPRQALDDDPLGTLGETRLVSLGGDPSPDEPQSTRSDVSDSGRFVAYQRGPTMDYHDAPGGVAPYEIHVRDQVTGDDELISPDVGVNTAPSISGAGTLVAYTSPDGAFVVDRRNPEEPVRHRVSGGAEDVPYQRVLPCWPPGPGETTDLLWDDLAPGACGPVLSGAGTSLAIPARLSLVAPRVSVSILGETSPTYVGSYGHGLAVVDFHGRAGETNLLRLERTIRLTVDPGGRSVSFGSPTIDSTGAYELFPAPEETPCAGATLEPGETCAMGVAFRRQNADCASSSSAYGVLRTNSPTSDGQLAFALVGDDQDDCPASARMAAFADAETCPDQTGPRIEQSAPADSGAAFTTVSLGEVDIGRTRLAVREITNSDPYNPMTIGFHASDCSIQLVEPQLAPTTSPAPCVPAESLEPEETCAAYFQYRPESVSPSAATVILTSPDAEERRFRAVGTGADQVVVMRRDSTGSGDFAGPGRPAARIVSIGEDGQVVRGTAPSLSTDGRYVAFVSGFGWTPDDRGTLPYQVHLHDTDVHADGSYVPGATRHVSRVTQWDGDESFDNPAEFGIQPALSGDASRIAFVDVEAPPGTTGSISASQVHVRDIAAENSQLISVPHDEREGPDAISYRPDLSRDGSTAVFTSGAESLLPDGVEVSGYAPQVYARDLTPDFGPRLDKELEPDPDFGEPHTDLVSMRPGTSPSVSRHAGLPSVNADGAVIGFASEDELAGLAHDQPQVYSRTRSMGLGITPILLDFPVQEVGTVSSSQSLLVTNEGPGPAHVEVITEGPFQSRGCEVAIHTGEWCEVAVSFTPSASGTAVGSLKVVGENFGTSSDLVVQLSGMGTGRLYEVLPATIDFPQQGIGTSSKPVSVRVKNHSEGVMDFSAHLVDEGSLGTAPVLASPTLPRSLAVTPPRTHARGLPGESRPNFLVNGPEKTKPACRKVLPGATCVFTVSFHPMVLGEIEEELQIVGVTADGLSLSQVGILTGVTATPRIQLSPAVAREGRVVFVSGEFFMPGLGLEMGWPGGQAVLPDAVPDDTGVFTAPLVILPGQAPGSHLLTVTMPELGTFEAPPVLIVQGSLQPPDFLSRN